MSSRDEASEAKVVGAGGQTAADSSGQQWTAGLVEHVCLDIVFSVTCQLVPLSCRWLPHK